MRFNKLALIALATALSWAPMALMPPAQAAGPAIDIETWATADGPVAGDYDTGKRLIGPDESLPLTFRVTNNGTEALKNIFIGVENVVATNLRNLSCDFSTVGGPATGQTFAGPLAVDASFTCTGEVPPLGQEKRFIINGFVQAEGTTTPAQVTDRDAFHAYTAPGVPGIDIEAWSMNDGPVAGDYDVAPKRLAPNAGETVQVVFRNSGMEDLKSVQFSVQLDSGVSTPVETECMTMSIVPRDDREGTFWPGEDVVCTYDIAALGVDASHVSSYRVSAVGATSGTAVTDTDYWRAATMAVPGVDVEKYSTADGPVAGDFDTTQKLLDPAEAEELTIRVTNTGSEALKNLTIADQTVLGPAAADLTCDFSAYGGPGSGQQWAGPLPSGATVTCTASVPAMGFEKVHSNTALVTAVGDETGTAVRDDDAWKGKTPPGAAAIDVEKYSTAEGPVDGDYDATPKELAADAVEELTIWVANTGKETLHEVTLTDALIGGVGEAAALECDYSSITPQDDQPTGNGMILRPDDYFLCTTTVPALGLAATHTDEARVRAKGLTTGTLVSDQDRWRAQTPDSAGIDIEWWSIDPWPRLAASKPTAGAHGERPGTSIYVVTDKSFQWKVTNTGTEPLHQIVIRNATGYERKVRQLTCKQGTAVAARGTVRWTGTLKPGRSLICTGVFPPLPDDAIIDLVAKASAVGVRSGDKVSDSDVLSARGRTIRRPDLPETGGPDGWWMLGGAGAVGAGLLLWLAARRRRIAG